MSIVHDYSDIARRLNCNKPKKPNLVVELAELLTPIPPQVPLVVLMCYKCSSGIPHPGYGQTYVTCSSCGQSNWID